MKIQLIDVFRNKRRWSVPLKLRPYGGIEICVLLLLLLEPCKLFQAF